MRIVSIACLLLFLVPLATSAAPPDKALAKAMKALERSPEDRDALRRVLETSHAAGGLGKLIQQYEKRVASSPGNGKLQLIVGHLYRRAGECDPAIRHYREAARLLPRSAGPHQGSAECHRQGERWGPAIESYQATVQRLRGTDDKIGALEELVQVALRAERADVVRSAYKQLTKLQPRDLFLRIKHARALTRAGRLDIAVEVWREIKAKAGSDKKVQVLAIKELGALLDRMGQHDEAVEVYRKALKRLPAEHWAQLDLQEGLIAVYRRQGRLDSYIAELEKRRGSYPVLLLLARLYEEVGNDKKALLAYRSAVTQRPANVEARAAMLRILKRVGSKQELIAEYKGLIRKVPGEPAYEIELAELYFGTGKNEKAFALLDRMSKRYNSDPGVHESIADLLLRHEGSSARIEREFEALMRLEPDEEQHIVQLGEYYFGENKPAKARATWGRLLKALRDKGKAHLILARLYAEHDMQEEAVSHFRQAIKRSPKEIRFYKSFATYLEKVNRYADALSAWEKIRELLPPSDHGPLREARQHIIQLLNKQNSLSRKMSEYKRAFNAEPPDLATGLMLAEGHLQLKEFEKAAAVLERFRRLRPRDLEALLYLEAVYEKLNRLADAIGVLQAIAKLAPKQARPRLKRMARLSMELHRTADALKYARLVVDLSPTDPDARTHLGDVHVQMRNFEAALAAYRRSLELSPGSYRVLFKLARVLERLGRSERLMGVLTDIVATANTPGDILNAGRRLMASPRLQVLEKLEQVLLTAIFKRTHKTVYRKLLVDLYAVMARRFALQKDEDPVGMDRRLRALGARGLKPILDSLGDSDLAVRTKVLRLLIETRNPNAVLQLVRLLEERDRVLRFQALVALGHIAAPSAVGAISKLTNSSEGHVGPGAVWALGMFEGKKAGKALAAVGQRGQRRGELPTVLALALGARGRPDGLETLERLLQGGKHAAPFAAWALGAIGDVRGVPALLRRLPVESTSTRHVIIWALGAIGSRKAIDALSAVVWGDDPDLVRTARWSLARIISGKRLDRTAIREAYLTLHDFSKAQLMLGSDALERLMLTPETPLNVQRLLAAHGKRLRKVILSQLAKSDTGLRVGLLSGLGSRKGSGLTLGALAPDEMMPETWRRDVTAAIVKLTTDPSREVRIAAVELAGRIGDTALLPPLAKALEDPERTVRVAAANAVGKLEAPDGVPALLDALQAELGKTWSGRAAGLTALARLLPLNPRFHARASQAVGALLRDPYPMVRVSAAHAIRAMGPAASSAAPAAIELLRDSDRSVVIAAIEALAVIRSSMALKSLQTTLKSPDPTIRAASRAAIRAIRGG